MKTRRKIKDLNTGNGSAMQSTVLLLTAAEVKRVQVESCSAADGKKNLNLAYTCTHIIGRDPAKDVTVTREDQATEVNGPLVPIPSAARLNKSEIFETNSLFAA